MSTSDFTNEPELDPKAPVVRPEPPRIVNLPTSFDMSEFFSEAVELQPFVSETAEPERVIEGDAGTNAPGAPTASVLEFPAHAPESPLVRSASAPPSDGVVTLVDILENQGGMTWRESVALVHQLCLELKEQSPHLPILLDPRNIQITQSGDVRLLPGQIGGDPLVMQIGRLLQTMVMGKAAPPELRLLVAQATFELPIFESIEDVDRALVKIERLDDSDLEEPDPDPLAVPAQGLATTREFGVDRPFTQPRPIRPPAQPRRTGRRMPAIAAVLSGYSARIVAGALIVVAIAILLVNPPHYLWRDPARPTSAALGTFGVGKPAAHSEGQPTAPAPQEGSPAAPVAPGLALESGVKPEAPRRSVGTVGGSRVPTANGVATSTRTDRSAPAASTVRTETVAPPPAITPRESERRASELVAQGRTAQAAMVFDALLMSNPLYEPKATDLTPESLAAFRTSQKLLLPGLAARGYDRAKAALGSGDIDRALAVAKETAAILDRPAANATPDQRQRLDELLEQATVARATVDEIIYTAADAGVIPPRPLSRQFPAATPMGVPPHRVGTLEMIIAKDGSVEFVKLHTPLNRYHERMIVSAAKAWTYRPAMKAGKPVKYRLTVQINLPENGTY
jgi:hypothetical protein